MARVRFAEIVVVAASAAGLAACGSSTPAPTAAPASNTSTVQAEPTTSAATTAAATSAPTTSAATSAPTASTAALDPSKVVAGTWLPASQFPLVGKLAWQLDPYHAATAGVAVDTTMDEQAPYYACQPSHLSQIGVGAVQSRTYHLDPAPSPDNTQVQQLQLFFTDPAAAKAGLATIQGWHSGCTAGPSQNTATATGGAAYVVTGGSTVYHEYFVQRGAVIDSLIITGTDAAASSVKGTSQDAATLKAMATGLCTYDTSAC